MEVAGGRARGGCGQLPWSQALLTDSSAVAKGPDQHSCCLLKVTAG